MALLLNGLWTGAKPTKRTHELLGHDFNGWATAEEVEHHLLDQKQNAKARHPPSSPRAEQD